jgi:hypothetical protein
LAKHVSGKQRLMNIVIPAMLASLTRPMQGGWCAPFFGSFRDAFCGYSNCFGSQASPTKYSTFDRPNAMEYGLQLNGASFDLLLLHMCLLL